MRQILITHRFGYTLYLENYPVCMQCPYPSVTRITLEMIVEEHEIILVNVGDYDTVYKA
ncbi:MAG: hypothetical protein P4L43_17290 [Syntrophobacteraceae bacterium]|nr:hypothetical protein [Syntrophobacteraceae bacterium]